MEKETSRTIKRETCLPASEHQTQAAVLISPSVAYANANVEV